MRRLQTAAEPNVSVNIGDHVNNLIVKAFLIILLSFHESSMANEIQDSLKKAITCGVDPLGIVYGIVKSGSNFKKGYSAMDFGEESDYTAVVTLENPIEFSGAKGNFVMASGGVTRYSDFGGFVFTKFSGDYKNVVAELNLLETTGEEKKSGKYARKLKIDSDGKVYDLCPMTIYLTPLEGKEFLLGCGWCNA